MDLPVFPGHDIQALKDTDEALLATEVNFRRLVEQSIVGIYIIQGGRFVYVNPKMTEIFGRPHEELTSAPLAEFVYEHDRDMVGDNVRKRLEGVAESIHYQVRALRGDGALIYLEAHGGRTLYEGRPAILGTMLDITERKHVEQALHVKQEHSMSLLRLARKLEGVNTCAEILKASREEMESTLGFHSVWFYLFSEDRRYLRLVLADNRTEALVRAEDGDVLLIAGDQMLEEIAAAEDIVVVEDARTDPRTNKQLVEKLGNRTIVNMPVTMSGRKMGTIGAGTFGEEGVRMLSLAEREFFAALASQVAVVLDRVQALEKRQGAEAALRQSEARFAKAFLANPAAMCITTLKDGRFIEVNDRYCRIFNHTRDELIGRTSLELKLWADPSTRALVVGEVRARGFIRDHEALFQRSNGELINALISMEIIEFRDENEPVIISMFFDITGRKQAEVKINQMNAELEQRVTDRTAQLEAANKELESFSYSVSHDLRGPLRAMDGFSRAMLEDFGPQMPEEGLRYLQVIRHSAQRMGNLIDDLLSFSRLSRAPLTKRPIDMGGLVQTALDDLRTQREGRSIDLKTGSLPPCEGDPSLLRQVWVNLLSNAFKYTQKREAAAVEIGSMAGEGGNVYFVRDNGTGFDMRYANKLFGVFQRLHRAEDYDGTGVGLAIVQRVVHRHGGRAWAEAAVDKGATFYFTLEGGKKS